MTANRARTRAIRKRMADTGESYTAPARHIDTGRPPPTQQPTTLPDTAHPEPR